MKRVLTIALVSIPLLVAGCGGEPPAPAHTAQPPAVPVTPSADSPTAPAETGIAAAVSAAMDGDTESRYFDATVDLDGDGRDEVVAYVAGPMACGTGGCPLLILTPTTDGYRLVTRTHVTRVPVRVSSHRTNGWRDLVVAVGGGGMAAGNVLLKFDGSTYPSNPTVPPAEPVEAVEDSELLLGEFRSYTEGKPF